MKVLTGYVVAAIVITLILSFYNPLLLSFAAAIAFLLVVAGARALVKRYGPDD